MAAFPANVPPNDCSIKCFFTGFTLTLNVSFYSELYNYKCNAYSTWGSDYDFSWVLMLFIAGSVELLTDACVCLWCASLWCMNEQYASYDITLRLISLNVYCNRTVLYACSLTYRIKLLYECYLSLWSC